MLRSQSTPFTIAIGFILSLSALLLIAILLLNHGTFTYALDDPYIHLKLAENIRLGHYGFNLTEFSSPSSSILWPFIIALFFDWAPGPLLLNLFLACATIHLFYKILLQAVHFSFVEKYRFIFTFLLIFLILATNMVGLVFIGMEHSLQIFLVSTIFYGLVITSKNNTPPLWLFASIIVAPLIRYECVAVSGAALLYLMFSGVRLSAILTLVIMLAILVGFSVFLHLLGLPPLPASVMGKTGLGDDGNLSVIIFNLKESLRGARGNLLLYFGFVLFAYLALSKSDINTKKLVAVSLFVISAHFVAGKYGWYGRYEIYAWTFLLLATFYISLPYLCQILEKQQNRNIQFKFLSVLFIGMVCTCWPYLYATFSTPLGANNIYEQQYQMRHFAQDFYKKPIAVNDIGAVAFQNDQYVLDLWGLASFEALNLRKTEPDSKWIDQLMQRKGVALAMIYDSWFPPLPSNWIKLGTLKLGKVNVTSADKSVSFYALNETTRQEAHSELIEFRKSLPPGTVFEFSAP